MHPIESYLTNKERKSNANNVHLMLKIMGFENVDISSIEWFIELPNHDLFLRFVFAVSIFSSSNENLIFFL